MKIKYLLTIFLLFNTLLTANSKFAPNSECKSCHPVISQEYESTMHQNSTIFKDPIHKAVWDKHPMNTKQGKYKCAKCHTPTASNLKDMLGKGTKGVPDATDSTHTEGISCAYCHRIESIEHGDMSNTNVVSKKEKHYFGTMKNALKSEFHTSSSENENFQNGNVCIGCHSHKKNKANLNVCSTNISNEMDRANCVSCHMPKVSGSASNVRDTKEHSFHGFPGAHTNQDMLSKYIELEFLNNIGSFEVAVNNKSSHALLLHPLRMSQLRVSVERNGKIDKFEPEVFVRVIGKDGKPTPPWVANTVIKDTMIKANEKRVVTYKKELLKGDKVHVTLGYFLVKPKALKKFGLDKDEVAKKFYVLKKETYIVK
ncbi:hypothetical protein SMGD1_2405 [Sulfurimonas gotlandica GD1]|uniref:Cytochrome c-552/4 domain-containing protein n=1 Tax=Sulfurimonas gotlandica (strain DSM 19862 / JCM 16533 / GD1) TaxID=929558 RepID=H1FZ44_SULGG|nr:multiheme c-type cytochrome [Sulfurimonas gotlandica]EHP30928.1 hypothetical protein SMGD1_2405 [Sulfurimonas gotlandica GD1]